MKKQKVMLLVNDTTYAYNLRKEVIEKLVAEGYEVVVVCALLLLQEELKALGCRLIGVENGRQGTNPVEDLKLFGQYIKILRKEKPDTVLSYNIKPNVYGGMACRLLGIRYIRQVDEKPTGDWADYLRGATWALAKHYDLHTGICGVVEGTLPIGGLSSSAAVIIAFLAALAKLNGIQLEQQEMIRLALEAEKDYVGVSVGTLDQSCEVLSKKNHLLYLDTKDGSYELIPQHPDMKPYKIAIMFSGIERTLVGSKFNMRVDEAKSAAYALMAYAGMEYSKFSEARLRDVPVGIYHQYKEKLPDNWRKRAEHFYTEFARVQSGAEAWRRGDIVEYGKLSFESGHSSVYNWETGSDELRTLYQIMLHTDGVYGGRFSGAGFKGCCMALIDPAYSESIERKVTEEYLKVFPKLEGKYSFHLCDSADGIQL